MNPFVIRRIEPRDNHSVQKIIEAVMPEFGANGPGFAITDPEVSSMAEHYSRTGYIYYVVEDRNTQQVLGSGGLAPLEGQICELQKMYFLKPLRGQGMGQRLITICLQQAKEMGYTSCYIETLDQMLGAQKLYQKNGFKPISGPIGNTGHFGCNRFYLKEL
jgi:putative acetyltransferase